MQMQGKKEGKNQKLCILNTISKSSSQSFCSKKKPKKKEIKTKNKIKEKKKAATGKQIRGDCTQWGREGSGT